MTYIYLHIYINTIDLHTWYTSMRIWFTSMVYIHHKYTWVNILYKYINIYIYSMIDIDNLG